jgi:hypothetical protein
LNFLIFAITGAEITRFDILFDTGEKH